MPAHLHEQYSGSNPVPNFNPVDALKRAVKPEKSKEHKLEKVQGNTEKEKSDVEKSQQTVGQLENGKEIPIVVLVLLPPPRNSLTPFSFRIL